MSPTFTPGVASRAGRRPKNEDAALVLPSCGLLAVSDGMGGLAAGEVASMMAVGALKGASEQLEPLYAALQKEPSPRQKLALGALLQGLAAQANEDIRSEGRRRRARMGATLTAALVAGGAAFICHVGDTRAYLLRGNSLRLLTEDTSVAALRLRAGRMTLEEYQNSNLRNSLYEALGISAFVDTEFLEVDLQDDDRLILCSDGVWEPLGDDALRRIAQQPDPHVAARQLVDKAFAVGSTDNLTAVVLRYQQPRRRVNWEPILRRTELFAHMAPAELRRLSPFLKERRLVAGERVVREGEPGDELLVLLEGTLHVSRRGVALTSLSPTQVFGEIALARACPRSATVTAAGPARVLSLHREQLNALIARQPVMGARLLMHLTQRLADRVVDLTERLTEPQAPGQEPPQEH